MSRSCATLTRLSRADHNTAALMSRDRRRQKKTPDIFQRKCNRGNSSNPHTHGSLFNGKLYGKSTPVSPK